MNLSTLKPLLRHKWDGLFCTSQPDVERLGQSSEWHVKTSGLNSNSVVYSAGVGKDISFEKALAERFGLKLTLLDPSPTGIETMSRPENQVSGIHFEAAGLAGKTGVLSFGTPINPDEGSYTIGNAAGPQVEFPCYSLGDLMRRNGHQSVDLLKMDIEGCEYEVIDHILQENLDIGAICVEFHHFVPGFTRKTTLRAVLQLRSRGYHLIHKSRHDYTFYRRNIS